jgi:hypothetical protein
MQNFCCILCRVFVCFMQSFYAEFWMHFNAEFCLCNAEFLMQNFVKCNAEFLMQNFGFVQMDMGMIG